MSASAAPALPDEAVVDYEQELQGLSKRELQLFPYKMKAEGNQHMEEQRYAEAVRSYLKALLSFHYILNHSVVTVAEHVAEYVDKIEKPVHLNLALAYLKLNNNSGVVFHCQKVLEIDPRNCKAYFRMSQAYANNCEYQKAEQALLKALAIEPQNPELTALWRKISEEKRAFHRQAQEVSKRIFTVPKNNSTRLLRSSWKEERGLPPEHGQVEAEPGIGLFNAVYLALAIVFLLARAVVEVGMALFKGVTDFVLSFWVIRIPFNVFVVVPWRITKWLFFLVVDRLEKAGEEFERGLAKADANQ